MRTKITEWRKSEEKGSERCLFATHPRTIKRCSTLPPGDNYLQHINYFQLVGWLDGKPAWGEEVSVGETWQRRHRFGCTWRGFQTHARRCSLTAQVVLDLAPIVALSCRRGRPGANAGWERGVASRWEQRVEKDRRHQMALAWGCRPDGVGV